MLFETVLIADLGAGEVHGLWNGTTDWTAPTSRRRSNDYKKLLTYTNTDRDAFDWTDATENGHRRQGRATS